MNKAIFFISLIIGLLVFTGSVFAAVGDPVTPAPPANNQIVGRDAIGLRVVPNPEHYSPLQWYNVNIKVKGAPQSLIVDGYEAVRDGRTVYVNAAKIARVSRCQGHPDIICQSDRNCPSVVDPGSESSLPNRFLNTAWAAGSCNVSSFELYTNIYIISYNQEPETATTDIFGQLLQYWKFNTDIKNCSNDPDRACTTDAECQSATTAPGGGRPTCQQTGICSQTEDKACQIDSDCPESEYCRSKKSAVIRDVRRLADLRITKERLESYNTLRGTYPALAQGTYLAGRTISTWPSWPTTFRNALGADIPSDPVNKLAACGNDAYDKTTCWDEVAKRYSASNDPLALPAGNGKYSYAYYYQYKPAENTFRLCGTTESGFIQGKAVGASLCQVNKCASCANRQCGTDGCGNVCGTCRSGQTCSNFRCVNTSQQGQDLN